MRSQAAGHTIQFLMLAGLFLTGLAMAVYFEQPVILIIPFVLLILLAGWQYRYQLFLVLLASLPFSFEYNFTSSLGTDIPDEGLMLLTSFVFFAAWLYRPASLPAEKRNHPLVWLLLLMTGWTLITVICSADPLVSVKYLLAKSWYLGAFVLAPLLLFRDNDSIRLAVLVLICSMLLVTVISQIRHSGYGFSFAGINDALAPFFRNHVNYSAMLVCMIPVWVLFYFNAGKKIRRWIAVAILLSLAALLFSYARGAWLALLTGAAAFVFIRKKILVTVYVISLVAVLAFAAWLRQDDRYLQFAHDYRTTIFHRDFGEHLVATYKLKDVSTAERFYRWIAGVRMVKDNPVTGYGPNTFYNQYKPYAVPAYKTWVSNNPEHSTVHNYFLLLLIEQGIPGLLLFILFTGALLWYAQRLYHQANDPFYSQLALTTGVVLVMIITVNFLSDLVETDKVGSLFFLCIALLVTADTASRNPSTAD